MPWPYHQGCTCISQPAAWGTVQTCRGTACGPATQEQLPEPHLLGGGCRGCWCRCWGFAHEYDEHEHQYQEEQKARRGGGHCLSIRRFVNYAINPSPSAVGGQPPIIKNLGPLPFFQTTLLAPLPMPMPMLMQQSRQAQTQTQTHTPGGSALQIAQALTSGMGRIPISREGA